MSGRGGILDRTGGRGLRTWHIVLPSEPGVRPWPPHGPFQGKAQAWEALNRFRFGRMDDIAAQRQTGLVKGPYRQKSAAIAAYRQFCMDEDINKPNPK